MGELAKCPFCGKKIAYQDGVRCGGCQGVSNKAEQEPIKPFQISPPVFWTGIAIVYFLIWITGGCEFVW